jgi:hypothetical protein
LQRFSGIFGGQSAHGKRELTVGRHLERRPVNLLNIRRGTSAMIHPYNKFEIDHRSKGSGSAGFKLSTFDHLIGAFQCMVKAMQVKRKLALSVRCPTCGAKPGEKCELSTGLPRTEPHRDRRLAGSKK